MIEIAQRVLAKAGHRVVYKVVPWTRAVTEGRKGTYTGIIGAAVDNAPDFVFPKNELGLMESGVFVAKDKNWVYTDVSSLPGTKIGVIKGYVYGDAELMAYIEKYRDDSKRTLVSWGDSGTTINIRNLAVGDVDAVIESINVFWYTATQMHMKDQFKMAGTAGKSMKVYIAFSPANPKSKEYARILSDGIDALRKSGELQTILAKYGLENWKRPQLSKIEGASDE